MRSHLSMWSCPSLGALLASLPSLHFPPLSDVPLLQLSAWVVSCIRKRWPLPTITKAKAGGPSPATSPQIHLPSKYLVIFPLKTITMRKLRGMAFHCQVSDVGGNDCRALPDLPISLSSEEQSRNEHQSSICGKNNLRLEGLL